MTISTNCAYNNQTHCNIKNLYFNKHKHKHMVNHICWNPSFFPLPNADIHEISNFYQKRQLFIKNYSFFIKNLIDPPYKKLQPQISPFIKNSIFGNNRDPCSKRQTDMKLKTSLTCWYPDFRPKVHSWHFEGHHVSPLSCEE